MPLLLLLAVFGALATCLAGCTHARHGSTVRQIVAIAATDVMHLEQQVKPPRIEHVTIVILENKTFDDMMNNDDARYIQSLASQGVLFSQSFAVTHPSQPNYLALYSGSTQGVTSDACPLQFTGPSLGGELVHAGKSIKGYFEDLPAAGSTICVSGNYARKHNPLINFHDTPPQDVTPLIQLSQDLAADSYPTVAFIVPNLVHDMHDGSVASGDRWLAQHLPPVLAYNAAHRGVLILTWDEDDRSANNHILTVAVGPMLVPTNDAERIDHYRVLRTVTDQFGLAPLTNVRPIALPAR